MEKKIVTKKIVLEYNDKDFCAIFSYENFLRKHINSGDKIPARVLKKYLSFFILQDERFIKELNSAITPIKNDTIKRYINDKKYFFHKKLPTSIQLDFLKLNSNKGVSKNDCSLNGLIDHIFSGITIDEIRRLRTKEIFIAFIHSRISSYFGLYQCNMNKILGKYKRDVIIGFITHRFRFHLSKDIVGLQGREPTNELLYQAVKYHTDRIEKAQIVPKTKKLTTEKKP